MTVSSTTSVVQYNGNGVTKVWPIPYRFFKDTNLVVEKRTVSGTPVTLTLNSDYTVSGANKLTGGQITTTFPLDTGELLTISRVLPIEQTTDLRNQGQYFAEVHEDEFDYLTMLIQQVNEGDSRALKHPRDAEHYQAEGRKIIDLQDPDSPQDAATMGWASRFFSGLIDSIKGVAGTASSIIYETGTLFDFIKYGVGRNVDSISALRLLTSSRNQRAFVLGYYEKGDGGGGAYYLDTSDTTTPDNGGTVVVSGDGGRWKLAPKTLITTKTFGAIWDGTSHPLSQKYASLAEAKKAYPFATALTQEIDWAATQAAHNYALSLKNGAEILFPAGKGYIGADVITIPLGGYSGIHQRGCGQGVTQLIHTGSLLFNVTYPEANWYLDYQGAQACSLHVSDMDITTTTADAATAYFINGGGFGGRASKASCFTNVSFHGATNNLQGWLYSIDMVNGLQFWFTNCRFIQVPGSTVGTSFRARLEKTANNPAPGGGGYYFLHCEHFFGKCAWDISPAIEGIYLTQCVTDGNILYGMIWLSNNVGGLQVVGGQISTKVCGFYLKQVVHGCFTGCDIRASAQSGSGWVGFEFIQSNGFAFGGAINLLGNGSGGQIGMRFTDCALSAMLPMVVDGVSFVSMDYAGYLSGNNNNNIHFGPGNVYTGVSVPVYDPGLKAVVTRRTVQLTQSIAFTGGAATEKKVITLPPYMFTNPNKPVMVIANAQGVDLIGTYLPNDALTTSVAAAVSFRLTTGGNIPAGTYTITALVS